MTKKLLYIAYEDFIEERASNWQIVNTVNMLSDQDLLVEIIFPYYFEIKDSYNLKVKETFLFNKAFNKFSYFNIIKFGLALFRKIKKEKIDLALYFRHLVLLPVIMLIKVLSPKTNVYYEVHREVNSKIGVLCEKILVSKNIKFIFISQALKNIYLQKYKKLLDTNGLIAHDGVDFSKFNISLTKEDAKKILGFSESRPAVVYAGSLWLVKGVDIILEAAQKLPDYDFYLFGKEKNDFSEIKSKFSNVDNLFIKEAVDQDRVAVILKAADLLTIPHPDNNLSQSPLKLFEYLASGTMILSSDINNLKEVIPEGNLFFNPGSVDDFVDKVKQFFSNREKYEKFHNLNIEISKEFTWESRAKKIHDFILND